MPGPIFCRLCGVGYASVGERPKICPGCDRVTVWADQAYRSKARPYRVTWNDRRFLRSIRIATDDPDDRLGAKE